MTTGTVTIARLLHPRSRVRELAIGAAIALCASDASAQQNASQLATAHTPTVTTIATSRPIAPLSNAYVNTPRPTFRWLPATGSTSTRVEVCADRGCTRVIASLDSRTRAAAPVRDLPTGVLFWRLRTRRGNTIASETSATWAFTVAPGARPSDTSWGSRIDIDGDGNPDRLGGTDGQRCLVELGLANGLYAAPQRLSGPADVRGFGAWIANAGDTNGDGYTDVMVTAWDPAPGAVRHALLFAGGANGPSLTASADIASTGEHHGLWAMSAGDVNGDGYGDVILTGPNRGDLSLYFGAAGGIQTTAATTLAFTHEIADPSYVSAGDVNGDGASDLVVFSHQWAPTGVGAQSRWLLLYAGTPTGLANAPPPGSIDVGSESVALPRGLVVRDLNGDRHADVELTSQECDCETRTVRGDTWHLGGPRGFLEASRRPPDPLASQAACMRCPERPPVF